VLYRVDERLIHGQVVVGWGSLLHPNRIVVVDDDLANSAWEQELYTLGLPGDLASEFLTVEGAEPMIARWRDSTDRIIVLTRDITTMQRLAAGGAMNGAEVNIGGIHYAQGRRPVLPYVYLSETELEQLNSLATSGVAVSARDLPNSKKVDAGDMVFIERRA
jgi:PTS system mannose-specific IIB component/fructoselysine and glucoselysine-specific PTS system IIB component